MEYLNKTFHVAVGTTKEYRDNWDRIFGPKEDSEVTPEAQQEEGGCKGGCPGCACGNPTQD